MRDRVRSRVVVVFEIEHSDDDQGVAYLDQMLAAVRETSHLAGHRPVSVQREMVGRWVFLPGASDGRIPGEGTPP